MRNQGPAAKQLDLNDSAYEIYEHFYDAGWTDGLPIIPPTQDLVEDMLRFTDRDPGEVISIVGKPPTGTSYCRENCYQFSYGRLQARISASSYYRHIGHG
ncbi:MAG: hypothetical protein CM1200mP15_14170 [Dehalococcoidia bacterium]|nr:MAG: hypothetical protein CM1200mP15_14170 [Dehalococcoidia bacterium]